MSAQIGAGRPGVKRDAPLPAAASGRLQWGAPPRPETTTPTMSKKTSLLLAATLAPLIVAGCSPIVATRGNLTEPAKVAQVKTGETTRDQVQSLLGTPTATGTLDADTWYYIGRRTEQTAFYLPDVVEQRIVRVRFDQTGVVSEMAEIDGKQARDIAPVGRTTPTSGRELGFFEQLFGSIGRPSAGGRDDAAQGGRGG